MNWNANLSPHVSSQLRHSIDRWILSIGLVLCFQVASTHPTLGQDEVDSAVDGTPPFTSLVAELAGANFEDREKATAALKLAGVAAYDALARARQGENIETGSRAARLIEQIDWNDIYSQSHPILADYASHNFAGRAKKIIRLSTLNQPAAIHGLARIAHFEVDEILARRAALRLVRGKMISVEDRTLVEETKWCPRVACRWIRAKLGYAHNPSCLVAQWQPLIEELFLAPSPNAATSATFATQHPLLTAELLRWYAEQLHHQSLPDKVDTVLRQLAEITLDDRYELVRSLDWALLHRFDAFGLALAKRCAVTVNHQPMLLYRLAELHRRQQPNLKKDSSDITPLVGGPESSSAKSQTLAKQANELMENNAFSMIQMAMELQHAGLETWAQFQLDQILDLPDLKPSTEVQARVLLANLLATREDDWATAQQFQLAMDSYQRIEGSASVDLIEIDLAFLQASRLLHLANHFTKQQDWRQARDSLLEGIAVQPNHPQLLAAMTAIPSTGDWKLKTNELIDITLAQLQDQIDAFSVQLIPNNPRVVLDERQLAFQLNQYAWLATKTGRDLALAERFGRRAVQLAPNNSAYVATLASLFYKQGKFQLALETQQRAIDRQPYSQQLSRSLADYQQAVLVANRPDENSSRE